jgi:CheY-like chemotaxis protein
MVNRIILIAEDDENDVLLLQHAFKKAGSSSSLYFVADGEAALSYLNGEGGFADRRAFPFPALLLLDLKMPKLDGLGVLAQIRKHPELRRLTVVIFTSSNETRDLNRAIELGVNSYLVKPAKSDDLTPLVRRIEEYWLRSCQTTTLHDRMTLPAG